MLKLALLFTAALAAFTGLADARDCYKGLSYCGRALMKKGDYNDTITVELNQHNQATDVASAEDSLFNCGKDGVIGFAEFCDLGCVDGGRRKDDFCG